MTPIEQAREALTVEQIDRIIASIRKQVEWNGWEEPYVRDRFQHELSLLSPSTPVDGVGAEPGNVAWAKVRIDTVPDEHGWCSCTPYNKHPVDVARGLATDEWNERGQFFGQVSLANPEAEARLRERVVELEAELDDWKANYYGDTKMFERRAEAAEARLAQAEGGTAVTEVRPLDEWHEDYGDAVWWTWQDGRWLGEPSYIGGPNDSDWPGYHTHWSPHPAFPAALHPQSAAGEEGKP